MMVVSESEFKEQSEIYGEEEEFGLLEKLIKTIEKFEYTVSEVGVTISKESLEYEPSIGIEEPKLKRIRERSSREVKITLSLQPATSKVEEIPITVGKEHFYGQFERLKDFGMDEEEIKAFKTYIQSLINLKLEKYQKEMSESAKEALANLLVGILIEERRCLI